MTSQTLALDFLERYTRSLVVTGWVAIALYAWMVAP
jgi:hypothetical protein